MDPNDQLLAVENLTTSFKIRREVFPAVRNVSFHLARNETLALVGESGCGKSMTALSIMRLVPEPAGRITSGEIRLKGTNLLDLPEEKMRKIRGNQVAMIFQEPMTCLNPVLTVGRQIAETLLYHRDISRKEARDRALDLMNQVRIPSASQRFSDYPHHFSGGMRQRVMIAMALACQPEIILADEPTTALDVTIQAQILALIAKLKEELNMAVMLITHNLGVVAEATQRVMVMYTGQIVEEAEVRMLFRHPLHPYTKGLLKSIPRLDSTVVERQPLESIRGFVADLLNLPLGCRFAPRCDEAMEVCKEKEPPVFEQIPGHRVKCWLVKECG